MFFAMTFILVFVASVAVLTIDSWARQEAEKTKSQNKRNQISPLVAQIISSLDSGDEGWQTVPWHTTSGGKITKRENKALGIAFVNHFSDVAPTLLAPMNRPLNQEETDALNSAWEEMLLVQVLDRRLALTSGANLGIIPPPSHVEFKPDPNEHLRVPAPRFTKIHPNDSSAEEEVFAPKSMQAAGKTKKAQYQYRLKD